MTDIHNLNPPTTPNEPAMSLVGMREKIGGPSLTQSAPLASKPYTAKPLAPATMTEALQELVRRQNEIKAALDVLISDATTLRLHM